MSIEGSFADDVSISWMRLMTRQVSSEHVTRWEFTKRQIAECNEVVVAKLARTDYPNSWCVSCKSKKTLDQFTEIVLQADTRGRPGSNTRFQSTRKIYIWEGRHFENTEMLETSECHSKGIFDNQAS